MERIQKNGRDLLYYPPYNTNLAPLDYHLFRFMKDQMQNQH
jgi:hypothetical protein